MLNFLRRFNAYLWHKKEVPGYFYLRFKDQNQLVLPFVKGNTCKNEAFELTLDSGYDMREFLLKPFISTTICQEHSIITYDNGYGWLSHIEYSDSFIKCYFYYRFNEPIRDN